MSSSNSSDTDTTIPVRDPRLVAYLDAMTRALTAEREQGMPRWRLTTPPHLIDTPEMCADRRRQLLAAVRAHTRRTPAEEVI